jgi:hypothetical protein
MVGVRRGKGVMMETRGTDPLVTFILRENIARFRDRLELEGDPARRAVLERLLAKERQMLDALSAQKNGP